MNTHLTLVAGGSLPVQAKPAAGTSAPGFDAEMLNALASAAAGLPLPEEMAAAGLVAKAPDGAKEEGRPDGFADIIELPAAPGNASSPAASQQTGDLPGQHFLRPGTLADAPLPGAAQTDSKEQMAEETPALSPALPAAGNSAPAKETGFRALPAPGARSAAEGGSPTAALSPQPGQQGSAQSVAVSPSAVGFPAAAGGITTVAATGTSFTGASAGGVPGGPAQQGGLAAKGADPISPLGEAQPGGAPAQLFAVAGQHPPAVAQAAQASMPAPAVSPPLNTQLQGPLFSLATAKPGEHTMTLSVTPDDLGPVTVRAHIGADGVRVELFAPNDAGREALRAILQDLKRDLASAGLGADLDLSSQNQPDEPGTGESKHPRDSANQDDTTGRQLRGPGHHARPYLRLSGAETGLDVLA